jgi:GGDEF domain-containing protein
MPLSISIGGAVFDRATIDRSEWLRRADSAMYAAKASGDNQFRMYRNQPEAAAAS